jgi:hypothetical protein
MLVGRCSWELSGRKLQPKIKKSQTPSEADLSRLAPARRGGICSFTQPKQNLRNKSILATDPNRKPQLSASDSRPLGHLRGYEYSLSASLNAGWCRQRLEAVDVKVFVEIEAEKLRCGAENEGAIQQFAQAFEYLVAYQVAE